MPWIASSSSVGPSSSNSITAVTFRMYGTYDQLPQVSVSSVAGTTASMA
jgi:hypothetical protein